MKTLSPVTCHKSLALLASFILLSFLLSACVINLRNLRPATPTVAPTSTPTNTVTATSTATPQPTATSTPLPGDATQTYILSLSDNGYAHLFAYAPAKLPPTRLTNGQWNDVSPSFSPDGQKIVFASDRNEYWDLYLLELETGQISRLTDTPDYDGNPSWSPDSQWIIYETLVGEQMEVAILSTVNPGQVIQLTDDPALDQEPAWSPLGRQIAFVSDRSGNNDIWVANLDAPENGRYVNVSNTTASNETRPIWSPDGTRLAWASQTEGQPDSIYVWDSTRPEQPPRLVGLGDWPLWSESGNEITTRLPQPNLDYLVAYSLSGVLVLPPTPMGSIHGMDWRIKRVTILPVIFQKQAFLTPTPLYQFQLQLITDIPNQRASVVQLQDVQAPHPFLHDAVDEAFVALRRRVVLETGWDALANLENAYTPLTSSLDPGMGEDWLYTGRAFALNPLTTNAGWMLTMHEEYNGQTYWRIYLRALAQDGSMGEPLRTRPWDLNARYSLDPQAYDAGGAYAQFIPSGYWIDFTELARDFGWMRLPALNNWRTYFKGTQFNEFVMTGGLDWRSAMLQLYPPDVFVTPTVVIPPTKTPTITPTGYRYKTPTPTVTFTPTPRPTFTPSK
jgi:TolB protein